MEDECCAADGCCAVVRAESSPAFGEIRTRVQSENADHRTAAQPAISTPRAELQMRHDPNVAMRLVARRGASVLGPTFEDLWPAEDSPCFSELLNSIDEADRKLRRAEKSARDQS